MSGLRIAILGCGPSGLVAAHAAQSFLPDADVTVLSRKYQSPIWGAQYLHQSIPGTWQSAMEIQPSIIRYKMTGTPEGYLRKVYGEVWDGHISDDLRDQAHLAHDLRATYKELWYRYESLIQSYDLADHKGQRYGSLSVLVQDYDIVLNTIPRPAVCVGNHQFRSTEIWAMGDSDEQKCPVRGTDGFIEYNGEKEPGWYRVSSIFGYTTMEWPGWVARPPLQGVARVRKPISHNCDCWTGDMIHLGRMGRWQKGRLVHHVYADTIEQLMLAQERTAS